MQGSAEKRAVSKTVIERAGIMQEGSRELHGSNLGCIDCLLGRRRLCEDSVIWFMILTGVEAIWARRF